MSPPRQPGRPAAANNQVVRAHLARKTLSDFLSELDKEGRRGELVTVSPGDSLAEASAALARANVLSAPVIDSQGGGGGGGGSGGVGGTFRGFFDVADYLRAVVELARERCPELLLLPPPPPPPEASPAAADVSAASAPSSSPSSAPSLLPELLLGAANDDQRRVRDFAHAAGEAWFREDDGGETSMLDVVVSGFRATARGARRGSSSAAFLAAAADPLSKPAHRVAVFGIERQDDGGRGGGGQNGGGGETPSTTTAATPAKPTTTMTTTADGPTLSWRVRGVVSQSDVVRYISDRSEREFEPALRQNVAELGFAPGVAAVSAGAAPAAPAAAAAAPASPLLAGAASSATGAGASSSPLVVLPAGTPALAAFAAMASRGASAVALVGERGGGGGEGGGGGGEGGGGGGGGALLACLTNSDLRGFSAAAAAAEGGGGGHFAALLRPAAEIAAAVAAEAEKSSSSSGGGGGRGGGIWAPDGPLLSTKAEGGGGRRDWSELLSPARARLVSVTPGASLGEALRKAAAARVHRVWVVEEGPSGRPVGVVGLGDMLRVLVQEDE